MPDDRPAKGVFMRLFGVVLVFLGLLDSLLSWRGGFALDGFYVFMIAAGISIFVVGTIKRGSKT
jgi:hypothetical protein